MRAETPLRTLERGAAELGVALTATQLGQFEQYLAELRKWNRKINLTGATTIHDLITQHVLDSLAGLKVLEDLPAGTLVADLGAGAGFPGLPIKLARQDLNLTLIEPREKRAAFLTTISALLKLQNLTVVEATLSRTPPRPDLAGRFGCVVMRAVSEPLKVRLLASSLLATGGRIVIWVSAQQAEHLGREFTIHRYRLPGTDIPRALAIATSPDR